ncbi:hypothetical protein [Thiolapillus sp.]
MNSKPLAVLAAVLLMTLGVMLYYSATPYMNMFVAPMINSLGVESGKLMLWVVMTLIALAGGLIAGFFSVFLFEMVSGGYRPGFMALVFAIPVVVIHLAFVIMGLMQGKQLPAEVYGLYLGEVGSIFLSYYITARVGRWVARRFFMTEAPVR